MAGMSAHLPTLAARLAGMADRCFVGRAAELRIFERALAASLPPFAVLWIHGPGGIGKSALLAAMRDLALASGRRVVQIDGTSIEPRPQAFADALGLERPDECDDPGVLLIDGCEHIEALQPWLREQFLPTLPQTWLTVCAGRRPPDSRWRHDAQWATLLQVHALSHLGDADASALLAARGVPLNRCAEALAWCRGHPLALSLMADVLRQSDLPLQTVEPSGSIVQALVERLVQDAPDARHLDALRVAAFVRETNEAVLAALLACDDARPLFDWLQSLGFMQPGPRGLVPHELVRDVLVADTIWRDPQRADTLRAAACRHYYERIARTRGRERLHHQAAVLYVLRHQPHKQAFFDWTALDMHRVEPAQPDDEARLTRMVERHEGPAARHWLAHWWQRQRAGFRLFWNTDGECDGFVLMLRLSAAASPQDRCDPAVAAALGFIERHRPLARSDELVVLRSWMHAQRYQAVSAAINLTAMHVVSHLVTHPDAAWSVVYMADPAFWQPHFEGVHFVRTPSADFEVGGRRFGAFVHDWRAEPAAAWIVGERHPMPFAAGADVAPADPATFVEAVRQALRDFGQPQALRDGALARALAARSGAPVDATALRARLCAALEQMAAHPRDRKFRDAVWHTYIEPMQKQEQVAAELGVPFATYRYRLQQGIERIASALQAG
jgi:hypothetical protein